jgi:glycosyl transferase family 25
MADIPILVLSLDGDLARFENVRRELSRFGLEPQRVRALDGRRKSSLLKRSTHRDFYCDKFKRQMTGGEIGCFASHLKALRRIVKSCTSRAIILEDDALFSDDFGAFYRSDLPRMLDAIDIIKLEGIPYPHSSRELTVVRGASCRAIVPLRPSLCSGAYAITLRGAKSLEAVANRISEPFDFVLNGYERYRAGYCEVRPFQVKQSGVPSVIGVGRNMPDEPEQANLGQRAHKAVGRLTSAGRTWFFARFLSFSSRPAGTAGWQA